MSSHTLLTGLLAASLAIGAVGCGTGLENDDRSSESTDDGAGTPGGKADYFGDDDRKDPRHEDVNERQTSWARSSALLAGAEDIEENDDGELQLASDKTYGESRNLCDDVPFIDQPVVPNCSSFLVAPDVMVTAGHCTEGWGSPSCEEMRFIFDFGYYGEDDAPTDISADQVYKCDELVASTHEGNELEQKDFAVVKLTEPVEDREPFDLRSEQGHVSPGDHLTLIGYPDGLPVKVDTGGVAFHANDTRFVATNDSFSGNSGGPVVNTATGEIEAVHVASGGDRFESEEGEACKRPKQCQEANVDGECQGSIGVHTEVWREHVDRAINGPSDDVGPDAGGGDAGLGPDAGGDAGTSGDASTTDTGTSNDADTMDAGTTDAGTTDAGTTDAGTTDAG